MRTWAVVIRILRQFRRDKRTLALMLIAPLFVLTLMNLVFNGKEYKPNLGLLNIHQVQGLDTSLKAEGAVTYTFSSLDEAQDALEQRKIDALITLNGPIPHIELEGSDPTINRAVLQTTQKAASHLLKDSPSFNPVVTYLHGSADMTSIDQFGPILIGFFIFFFVFLIAGVSFLRERTTGTLERLLSTPLKRWEIVLGYVAGYGIFTIVQALLISWYCIQVLGIMMVGSFGWVLLLTLLMSLTALTLGTLISAYANNELQMIQFIPIIIVPQLFLSGLFPLDTLPEWLKKLEVIMPLAYGAKGLSDVMIRGKGWDAIASDVIVLAAFSITFILLNILALRKYRKI
ncbi:ABC transporter permease [Paenibacillus sp. J22TS3]|uniref:ABC transporter permease n=1 Tax=Paenibacillus sp. J22TS3 TaxID=2807192 RepID=UPI001B0B5AEE|nr:ABC transporter permease [Paenibacillus sp. J22TS3]GIP22453.1 transport permease protein [Paenibacillus sp. J22TS3]